MRLIYEGCLVPVPGALPGVYVRVAEVAIVADAGPSMAAVSRCVK